MIECKYPENTPLTSYKKGCKCQRCKTVKLADNERHRLQTKYGMTLEDFHDMLEDQSGKCAICGSTDKGNSRHSKMSIDHCHVTNKVRGILCNNCNAGLGFLKDNIEILQKAIQYLRERN